MKIHCLDPNGINIHEKEANEILEKSLPDSWKGYSSLEMIGKQANAFETDIIIITADRIIVVELKDYNGDLYSRDGKWVIQSGNYEGTRTNGARQVSTAAKILASRIESKLEHKLPMVPWVDKCVVLCGSATNEFLPEDEQKIVFSLEEFKNIGNPKKYIDFFGDSLPHWCTPNNNRKRPNQNLSIWDKFFTNNSADFKPKTFTANGYAITGKALFQHKDKIYSEYRSQRKNDRNYKALMRRWDFTASTIRNNARTPDERELIAYRESKVLGYIDNQDESLKSIHLNLLYTPENATADFVELYEWPRNRLRLNEFIAKNKEKLNPKNRLDIIQIFLSHLARLHEIDVAHRDIGAHSVWVSLPSGISLSNFLTASYPDPKNKTVCNVREYLKHGRVEIPEDLYEDSDGTPYTRDVYLAGAVAHYIAYNRWPKKDEDGVYFWESVENDLFDGILNDWLKTSLNYEAKERFQNINLALDDFNSLIKGITNQENSSLQAFEEYHSDINVYLEYQPLQSISTKGTSMLFRSGNGKTGVKLWNGVSESTSNGGINHHLLTVLGRIQQLKNTEFDNISRIIDFGYNPSMQSLFIAYEWLEGVVWSEWIEKEDTISREELETAIYELLKSTAHIHRLGFIHGDIHPKNIILKNGSPIFIDLIEFSNEGSSYNPSYVPDNFENLSLIARDRYAVVKMALEVADKQNLIHLAEHCRNLIEQPEVSEGDFNRLIDNYKAIVSPPPAKQISIYEIKGRNFKNELEEIESDDGLYYISSKIEKNNHGGLLKLLIVGFKQQVYLHINTDHKFIVRCYPPKPLRHDQFIRKKRKAEIELEGQIILHNGSANHADEFI
ncbi:MAG TPA: hypothetical protein ENK66_06725, partial [Arcobacter sp.]|nr:hypothetical protein [Arcobacter sp.]